jgi:glycosyltransferase involved in cell wall biosynthesis
VRVAYLTPEYVSEPKFDGGLANYLFRITKGIESRGHQAEVFVSASTNETLTHEGIIVHRCAPFPIMDRLHAYQRRLFRKPWLSYMDALGTAATLTAALRRRHAQAPFDLVEGSNFKLTSLFLGGSRSPPVVTRISYVPSLWAKAAGQAPTFDLRMMDFLHDLAVRRSAAAYGPCGRIADFVSARAGCQVDVVPPPLFLSVKSEAEEETVWSRQLASTKYLLFFGRVCRLKGVDILARAAAPVLADDPSLRLVLVGRPETDEILPQLSRLLGGGVNQLVHINRLRHNQLFPIIRRAAAVVLPSRIDNLPNACVEAMGLGQLVIGTAGTGFDELIEDDVSGLLALPEDVESLEGKIRQVFSLPDEKIIRLKANARDRILRSNPEGSVDGLIQYYQMALGQRSAHGRRN